MNIFRNKGIAFFIALNLLILLSIGAAVFLLNTYRHVNINEAISNRTRAILIAESGIAYAYWRIRIDQDQSGGSMAGANIYTFDTSIPINSSLSSAWSLVVKVTEPGGGSPKTIDSIVTYPKSTAFP